MNPNGERLIHVMFFIFSSCVSAVQCEGEIDPRQGQSVFDVSPTCKKSSDICCHESKVKLPDLCVDYSRDGYKCVAEDLCVPPQNTGVLNSSP